MQRRSRFIFGSLLIAGTTCLGIAFTSTSATPALTAPSTERSIGGDSRPAGQTTRGAGVLMALGGVMAASSMMLGKASRHRSTSLTP